MGWLMAVINSSVKVGVRVEIAPHYDLWMQGARYGKVIKLEGDVAVVQLDHWQVRRPRRFLAADLKPI